MATMNNQRQWNGQMVRLVLVSTTTTHTSTTVYSLSRPPFLGLGIGRAFGFRLHYCRHGLSQTVEDTNWSVFCFRFVFFLSSEYWSFWNSLHRNLRRLLEATSEADLLNPSCYGYFHQMEIERLRRLLEANPEAASEFCPATVILSEGGRIHPP